MEEDGTRTEPLIRSQVRLKDAGDGRAARPAGDHLPAEKHAASDAASSRSRRAQINRGEIPGHLADQIKTCRSAVGAIWLAEPQHVTPLSGL